jgi:5-methylcytosine-specific restriction endonuclease McrA
VPSKNPRITDKDLNLIKGGLRRVFSRSELRRSVLNSAKIDHWDGSRPRVRTWYKCELCGHRDNANNVQVDHIEPVVPLDRSLQNLDWEELINRLWCDPSNLQILCLTCHKEKSKIENKERRKLKKEKKDER